MPRTGWGEILFVGELCGALVVDDYLRGGPTMSVDLWFAFMLGAFVMWLVCMAVIAVLRFIVLPRRDREDRP